MHAAAAPLPDLAARGYTSPRTGRVYVEIGDIAAVTGLRATHLDYRFRPAAWASPRDFTWQAGQVWFAVASLPQLVEALFDAGEGGAAHRLREALAGWLAQLGTTYFDAGKTAAAPQREMLDTSAAPSTAPAAAACIDSFSRPVSGADAQARWEAEHA